MEKTRLVLLIGRNRKWRMSSSNTTSPGFCKSVTSKAPNRAAVHGVKAPVADTLDEEEVQKNIQNAKEEKEAKRKQIEKTIESHISDSSKSDSSSAR
ncbi:hypothetical protein VNO77_18795 [Canavalia gladiata]|uniref:Uncharacterized protein n=1 Tax=Canavalia gladiata TaxID=3824 RepID=A0AAN9QP07_CANGL